MYPLFYYAKRQVMADFFFSDIFIFLIGILFISVLIYYRKKRNIQEAKKLLYVEFSKVLDELEFDVMLDFNLYQANKKITKVKDDEPVVVKTSKYLDADVEKAFSTIKNNIINEVEKNLQLRKPNFFNWDSSTFHSGTFDTLKMVCRKTFGKKESYLFFNDKIINYAYNIAVENAEKKLIEQEHIFSAEETNQIRKIKKLRQRLWEDNYYGRHGEEMSKMQSYKPEWLSIQDRNDYIYFLEIMSNKRLYHSNRTAYREEMKAFLDEIHSKYSFNFQKEIQKRNSKRNLSLGAEFIILRAFAYNPLLGFHYPIGLYKELSYEIKEKKKEQALSL